MSLEDDVARAVGAALGHCLDGQGQFGLLAAAGLREFAPVRLAGHFPVALSVEGERLLVLGVDGAGHRRTAHQLVVGSNALEILPATGRLILRDARFRHLKGEVVLGNAVESTRQYMGGLRALADNTANAIAVGKRTAIVSPCSLITDTL